MATNYTKNPIIEGDGDPRHGTLNGYTRHRCRCPECTAAATKYKRELRGLQPRKPAEHGTRSKYSSGCRCPECTEAERVAYAAWRQRQKEKQEEESRQKKLRREEFAAARKG